MKMGLLKNLALWFSLAAITASTPVFAEAHRRHHSHSHSHHCNISPSEAIQLRQQALIAGHIILSNLNDFFVADAAVAQSGGDPSPATNPYLANLIVAETGPESGGAAQQAAIILHVLNTLDPNQSALIASIGEQFTVLFRASIAFSVAVNTGGDAQAALSAWIAAAQVLGQELAQLSPNLDPTTLTNLVVSLTQTQAQKIIDLASSSLPQAIAAVTLDQQAHNLISQIIGLVVDQLIKDACPRKKPHFLP
jgi:hypothetical protein